MKSLKKIASIVLLIIFVFLYTNSSAQHSTHISNDLKLIRWGNMCFINNLKNQSSWTITVDRKQNEDKEWVYSVYGGNYSAIIFESQLRKSIREAVIETKTASLLIGSLDIMTDIIYSDVCEYYGESE